MASLRCSGCGHDFPINHKHYSKCPDCKQPTWPCDSGTPMSESEARHIAFDAFYAEREVRLSGLESLPVKEEK